VGPPAESNGRRPLCGPLPIACLNLSDGQHQENMTAAPRSFRGSLSGGVKKCSLLHNSVGTNPLLARHGRAGNQGENQKVAGKEYLTRQAATLLKLAQSTKDRQIAAGLVDKAADLKSQVDSAPDRSPPAPDIEV